MRSWLRPRLTYSNVMATIAVFVALGGSSYAAVKITGKQVKNSSLTGRDVRNNSLTGADVKKLGTKDVTNGGLLAEDFKAGQIPRGEQGPQGPPGIPPKQTLEMSGLSAAMGHPVTSSGCVILTQPTAGSVLIDLPLPAGAHITEVRARYRDTSPGSIQFGLEYVDFDGSMDHIVAGSGGSSNSPEEGLSTIQTDPGFVFPPVSDRLYYYLFANPDSATDDLWFCGVAVDYTLG